MSVRLAKCVMVYIMPSGMIPLAGRGIGGDQKAIETDPLDGSCSPNSKVRTQISPAVQTCNCDLGFVNHTGESRRSGIATGPPFHVKRDMRLHRQEMVGPDPGKSLGSRNRPVWTVVIMPCFFGPGDHRHIVEGAS